MTLKTANKLLVSKWSKQLLARLRARRYRRRKITSAPTMEKLRSALMRRRGIFSQRHLPKVF